MGATAPSVFRGTAISDTAYWMLLDEMQRFRGRVYLADGAIDQSELTGDGRHALDIDSRSWHLLALDDRGAVCGCVRILEQTGARGFDQLWIRHCELARSHSWNARLRDAIEAEMRLARRQRLWFAEVGGLAIAPERRCTTVSLRTILATFGLLQLMGGAKCVATVTSRHACAPILCRIGLSSLYSEGVELPPYYDPQYGCEMQVLRFDSRFPNARFACWVGELSEHLKTVPVIAARSREQERRVAAPVPALQPAVANLPYFVATA